MVQFELPSGKCLAHLCETEPPGSEAVYLRVRGRLCFLEQDVLPLPEGDVVASPGSPKQLGHQR